MSLVCKYSANSLGGRPSQKRVQVVANAFGRRWIVGGAMSAAMISSMMHARPVRADEDPQQVDEVKTREPIKVELTPKDAFYVAQALKLAEVLDDYVEVMRLNHAEYLLCKDEIFLHTLMAYDIICKKIEAPEVKSVLEQKYQVFNMRCLGEEEIMWA